MNYFYKLTFYDWTQIEENLQDFERTFTLYDVPFVSATMTYCGPFVLV